MRKFGFSFIEQIDIGMSILTYQKNRYNYVQGHCFNNAFAVLSNTLSMQSNNKAIFGYVLSTDGKRKVAVRHAWNKINDVFIDVTMIANDENPFSILNFYYLPINEYDIEEFLVKVEQNKGYPCLPKTEKEKRYIKKLQEKGFELLE